jgi:Reversibly glycosylated polypeptide
MIACVMPTIYVPNVLRLYREIAPEIEFFVIGDVQAPDEQIREFLKTVQPARYYSAEDQRKLGYECCDLLAWRHPGRRSIGLLEAVKAGADIIVHADDDNTAIEHSHFQYFERLVGSIFTGLEASSDTGWVDAGWFLQPSVHHRGFPHQLWHPFSPPEVGSVREARIGVAAGLWLGDPDIDAVTRIVNRPTCMTASPVADSGFVVDRKCYSPFNSQNTAFARELLPAMVMLTSYGRFDDIWCSYIACRVMRDHGWVVHYGKPYVWQQRLGGRDKRLMKDLADEVYGMTTTLQFTRILDDMSLPGTSLIEDVAHIHEKLAATEFAKASALGAAWVRDVERVLK